MKHVELRPQFKLKIIGAVSEAQLQVTIGNEGCYTSSTILRMEVDTMFCGCRGKSTKTVVVVLKPWS